MDAREKSEREFKKNTGNNEAQNSYLKQIKQKAETMAQWQQMKAEKKHGMKFQYKT